MVQHKTQSKNTVVIADDHPLFRSALQQTLTGLLPQAEFVEVPSLSMLQAALERQSGAAMVMLDLNMPGTSGFTGLVFLKEHYPDVPVVAMSATEDDELMRRAAGYGACAFVAKTDAVERTGNVALSVWRQNRPLAKLSEGVELSEHELRYAERLAQLTPKQFRVLMMLAEGLLNKQIAYELNVSEATIKAHVTAILRKLEVSSRTQAVIGASRLGMSGFSI